MDGGTLQEVVSHLMLWPRGAIEETKKKGEAAVAAYLDNQRKEKAVSHLLSFESFGATNCVWEGVTANIVQLQGGDLLSKLPDCHQFIRKALKQKPKGTVLVVGDKDNYASALLASYLMKYKKTEMKEAISKIESFNNKSMPISSDLIYQLQLFASMGCKIDADHPDYIAWAKDKKEKKAGKKEKNKKENKTMPTNKKKSKKKGMGGSKIQEKKKGSDGDDEKETPHRQAKSLPSTPVLEKKPRTKKGSSLISLLGGSASSGNTSSSSPRNSPRHSPKSSVTGDPSPRSRSPSPRDSGKSTTTTTTTPTTNEESGGGGAAPQGRGLLKRVNSMRITLKEKTQSNKGDTDKKKNEEGGEKVSTKTSSSKEKRKKTGKNKEKEKEKGKKKEKGEKEKEKEKGEEPAKQEKKEEGASSPPPAVPAKSSDKPPKEKKGRRANSLVTPSKLAPIPEIAVSLTASQLGLETAIVIPRKDGAEEKSGGNKKQHPLSSSYKNNNDHSPNQERRKGSHSVSFNTGSESDLEWSGADEIFKEEAERAAAILNGAGSTGGDSESASSPKSSAKGPRKGRSSSLIQTTKGTDMEIPENEELAVFDKKPEKQLKKKNSGGGGASSSPLRRRKHSADSAVTGEKKGEKEPRLAESLLSKKERKKHSSLGIPESPVAAAGDKKSSGRRSSNSGGSSGNRLSGQIAHTLVHEKHGIARLLSPSDPTVEGPEITAYEDLPKDLKAIILFSKVPLDKVREHFDIALNIFYFQKRIVLHRTRREARGGPITPRVPGFSPKPEAELIDTTINPSKAFSFIGLNGEGGYGKVYAAKSNIQPKGKVAIKRMAHTTEKEKRHNVDEINFLKFCDHPNVVKYYYALIVKSELWAVMEFMEGGTLTEASKGFTFKEPHVAYIAKGLLQGLVYLHDRNLVHRDLKSANIMLTIKGQVKLIDFGLCVDVSKGARREMVGSPFWMPPEMIQRRPHSFEVDIWSFAISLLELTNKIPPYRKSSFKAMFTYATEGCPNPLKDPTAWSETFKEFLDRCLQVDPKKRSTAAELLEHPFLAKACKEKEMAKILRHIFMKTAIEQVIL